MSETIPPEILHNPPTPETFSDLHKCERCQKREEKGTWKGFKVWPVFVNEQGTALKGVALCDACSLSFANWWVMK